MFTNRLFHLLILAVLTLTACAPQAEVTSTATPVATETLTSTAEPTPMPTATQTPTATVQPTRTATKIPVYLPFAPGKYVYPSNPDSYFTFSEEGRWANYIDGFRMADGTYSIDGDLYIQLSNSHGCPRMSFRYSFDGTLLKFQLTDESKNDPCGDRADFYNNKTYIFSE